MKSRILFALLVGLIISLAVASLPPMQMGHFSLGGGVASATTLTGNHSASKDSYIYSGAPTTNYGTDTAIELQCYSSGTKNGLLEFDLSGLTPYVIQNATLHMNYYNNVAGNASGRTVWVYGMTQPTWVESTSDWNFYNYSNILGTTTAGGSSNLANYACTSKWTASANDTVSYVWVYSLASTNAKVTIYADSSDSPGTRLGGAGISTAVVANQWNLVPLSTAVSYVNGTSYWVSVNSQAGGGVAYGSATQSYGFAALTYANNFPTSLSLTRANIYYISVLVSACPWTVAGGDYTTTTPVGASSTVPTSYGEQIWDVTALVFNATNYASGKVEFLLKDGAAGNATNYDWQYYSTDYSVPSDRPYLEVTYSQSLPAVSTSAASSITSTSVILGGNISSLGSAAQSQEGASLLKTRFPAERYVGTHDRTYFAWIANADNGTIYVNFYDHTYDFFGTPVSICTNNGINAHNSPTLHVIPSGTYAGYILVSWGNSTSSFVARSSSPESISVWSATQTIETTWTGYRQFVHLGNGNEVLFYQYPIPNYRYDIGYRITTDGGQTWGDLVNVTDFGGLYWTYPTVVSSGNTTHLAFLSLLMSDGVPYYRNIYYIRSTDNLTTWSTHSGNITLPATSANSESVYTKFGTWIDDIQVDGSGSPVISFVDYVNTTTCLAKWAKYSAGWLTYSTGQNTLIYVSGQLMAYNSGIFIDPVDTTHVYIGVRTSTTASDIQEWHTTDGGTTWAKVVDVTTGSTTIYDEPRPVVNYNANLKFIYNNISAWTSNAVYTSSVITYPVHIGTQNGNLTKYAWAYGTSHVASPSGAPPSTYTGNSTSVAGSYGVGTYSVTITGLTPGQTYFFDFVVFDGATWYWASNEGNVTMLGGRHGGGIGIGPIMIY